MKKSESLKKLQEKKSLSYTECLESVATMQSTGLLKQSACFQKLAWVTVKIWLQKLTYDYTKAFKEPIL